MRKVDDAIWLRESRKRFGVAEDFKLSGGRDD